MQTKMRNTLKLLTVLLLVLGLLGSGLSRWNAGAASLPASSACSGTGTVTCNLWAKTGSFTPSGGPFTTIWGYTDSATGSPSAPGGPVLIVNQGDTVTVNLTNNLAEATGLLFNGQAMVPDTSGAAANVGTKSYIFTASQPGTFLYQASPLLASRSAHQVAMGLYGALIVRPATAGQAYNSASTAFNEEALLLLSELDPALNNSVSPAAFDLRTYHPTYFLINGKSYPDTDLIDVIAGNKVLLRFVNAGLQAHSMSLLGLAQNVIAVDGKPFLKETSPGTFTLFPRRLSADTIFSGQTSDVIVNMPAAYDITTNPTGLKGIHKYAIYDAIFTLSNKTSNGFGGMLTFLNMDTGVALDDVGPATSGVSLSPDKVGGASPASVALSATVSDALSGNSNIQAAEYYIDSKTASPTTGPFTMAASDGFFDEATEAVQATIATSGLSHGSHTIYVRGQDDAGNWGTFGTAVLTVDKAGPAIFSLELVPNPSDGSSVLLHITADDRASGKSEVTSVTYTVDGGAPVILTPEATAASTFYFMDELTGSAGTHTVSVFATDQWGNQGDPATIYLVVDQAGPTTSSVAATPGTTNGIGPGVNSSIAAVRLTATFTDGPSTVSKAEGFLTPTTASGTGGICQVIIPGSTGTGFVFVSTDGLFDSLSETGYADIPLAQFWILKQTCGAGSYTVHVHAQDASGNWGGYSTTTVTVTP